MCELRQFNAVMRAAVNKHFGGDVDAVAATFSAFWEKGTSKGTISRKMNGSLEWTVADMIAMEGATGDHVLTKFLARRLRPADAEEDGASIVDLVGSASKEGGEGVAAALASIAASSGGDRAVALREVREAIDAFRRLESAIRAMDEDAPRAGDAVPLRGAVS